MTPLDSLRAWYTRAHIRSCYRPPGTNGTDDQGANAGCTCPVEVTKEVLAECRSRARKGHLRYKHPGEPDACQSPHDVLCKAVWA